MRCSPGGELSHPAPREVPARLPYSCSIGPTMTQNTDVLSKPGSQKAQRGQGNQSTQNMEGWGVDSAGAQVTTASDPDI